MSLSTIAAIRFDYGLSPVTAGPSDAGSILAALADPDEAAKGFPVPGTEQVLELMRRYRTAQSENSTGQAGAADRLTELRRLTRAAQVAGLRAQLQRAVTSPDGFRERLQFFWADHFTVEAKGPVRLALPSAFAEDAIRPHLAGRFTDMLRAVVTHPAMLIYLDQTASIGPNSPAGTRQNRGLNENLGREILELHTLGVGADYSQKDVREFAELLTGLVVRRKTGFEFLSNRAEPGGETLLGETYGDTGPANLDDIFAALDAIALHPATARHIAHKLCVHFVSDDPDPDLVDHVATAFVSSQGALDKVYQAMLEHPAAWAPLGAKVRQPWDFVAASLRALGTSADRINELTDRQLRAWVGAPMAAMGQPYQAPAGPDGWAEEAGAWITPPLLATRIQWAMQIRRLHGAVLPDPRSFAHTALAEAADAPLVRAARQAESRRHGVALILASPEFNRR